jgi:hypothetical protein
MSNSDEQQIEMAKAIFARLSKELGAGPENRVAWSYLAMALVLWVTWKAAHGEKETAQRFARSFYDKLMGNIDFNTDDEVRH